MSKYNFDFAVSAELNEETVKTMVKQVVEEQTGRKVRQVIFKTGTRSYSYRDEPGITEFTGCTVYFE
jgi:membrane carboxypeptidase/penicillin-binding protein PbpC